MSQGLERELSGLEQVSEREAQGQPPIPQDPLNTTRVTPSTEPGKALEHQQVWPRDQNQNSRSVCESAESYLSSWSSHSGLCQQRMRQR